MTSLSPWTVTAAISRARLSSCGSRAAASARAASVMSAHTAEKIISIVTVQAADRPAAVAVALAVVSDELRRPVA